MHFGRREKYVFEHKGFQSDIEVARHKFQNGEYFEAFDVYEQLATLYPTKSIEILAETYDCYQRMPLKDRYHLYQGRIFDFGISPDEKVLDIGSGHNPFPLATHLADISLEDHQYGRAGAPFKFVDGKPVFECSVEQTPFKDKEFDFVYCSHVLEHTHDPVKACKELMRIGKRGYIETPAKAKDIFLNSAKISNHTMYVEVVNGILVFTDYKPEEIEGFQCDILMDMHTNPQTIREKAFSALLYLKPHLVNTMFLWKDHFDYKIQSYQSTNMVDNIKKNLVISNDQNISEYIRSIIHQGNISQNQLVLLIQKLLKYGFVDAAKKVNDITGRLFGNTPVVCFLARKISSCRTMSNGLNEKDQSIETIVEITGESKISRENSLPSESLKFMQVHTYYSNYLNDFYNANPDVTVASFDHQIDHLIRDGYGAVHIVAPYMSKQGYQSQFIIANNFHSQTQWIQENGIQLDPKANWLYAITKAQIEYYQPDVLYLTDPVTFDSRFVRSLSWSPRLVIGWKASDIPETTDWSEFDIILSNLKSLKNEALKIGARSVVTFFPGFPVSIYDQVKDIMPQYDLMFSGQWTYNQHLRRNRFLEVIAKAASDPDKGFSLAYYLSGQVESLPDQVASHNLGKRFGLPMYRAIRSGKIAFDARGRLERKSSDGTVDLAGNETANMRIFEVTGCGVFLLTEYFDNLVQFFEPGKEIETFTDEKDLLDKIRYYIANPEKREEIAIRGMRRCHEQYCMEKRAAVFDEIIRNHLPKKTENPITLNNIDRNLHHLMDQAKNALTSNDTKMAFQFLNEAKSLRTPLQGLDYLRAVCFLRMNQPFAAREALLEEMRLFPNNQVAKQLLDQVMQQYPLGISGKVGDEEFNEILKIIRPYTMSSEQRLFSLYSLAKRICQEDIAGNFVECGVAAGGSTALLAAVVRRFSRRQRWVYAFDSFEGMPEPGKEDVHRGVMAIETGWGTGTCAAPEKSVRQICTKLGVSNIVVTVKGYFQDTLPAMRDKVGMIALLHMDGDWYESTKTILTNLYDRLVNDAFVQVDDYGYWEGCKKALHEFESQRQLKFSIHPIDGTGVWFQRPDQFPQNPDLDPMLVKAFHTADPAPKGVDSQMSVNERFQLFYAARELIPKRESEIRFIEIGSWAGASLLLIHKAISDVCDKVHGYSIEPGGQPGFQSILKQLGSSVTHLPMFSHEAANQLSLKFAEDGNFPLFIFVDGSHTYEGVRQDIIDYFPLLAPGGLMVFHDYLPALNSQNKEAILFHHSGNEPGIRKACQELMENTYHCKAIDIPLLYPTDPTQTQAHLPIIPGVFSTVRAYRKPV